AAQAAAWASGLGTAAEQRLADTRLHRDAGMGEPVEHAIAGYVAGTGSRRDVLLDARLAYPVVYWSGGAGLFYTSADAAWEPGLLGQPPSSGVRYVLVSHLAASRGADAI